MADRSSSLPADDMGASSSPAGLVAESACLSPIIGFVWDGKTSPALIPRCGRLHLYFLLISAIERGYGTEPELPSASAVPYGRKAGKHLSCCGGAPPFAALDVRPIARVRAA